jgi:hypothetical protein
MYFIGFDANFTNGKDPSKIDALFADGNQTIRVKQTNYISLKFDVQSIHPTGDDVAVLTVASPYGGWAGQNVTAEVAIGDTTQEVQVALDASGVGTLEIVSATPGEIDVSIKEVVCEPAFLEVQDA